MERIRIPMEELVPVLLLQMEQGGQATLPVLGSSMQPLWKSQRDQVVLVPPDGLETGHPVLLYRRDNGDYILHRLVRRKKTGWLCCGDNQWQREPVRQDQVVAMVAAFTRKGKSYTVYHRGYRLYVWLWSAMLPIRRPLLAVRRWLGRMRKILRRKQS